MKSISILLLVSFFISAKSQPIIPEKGIGSKFFINCANVYFEVDSARGARISSFKLDGTEIMYVDFKKTDMAGSTFWQSPQTWPWPPAVNLDSKPYRAIPTQNKIVFKGATDTRSQLRFYKTISANAADTSIIIDYCIKNEKTTVQKWAPWEITRVVNSGLTVFAKGEGKVTGDMASRTKETTGYVWYDQDETVGGAGAKFFCDGKGWLAHVVDGEMLFIKKFEDVPKLSAAPNEAEVEVYTAPDQSYTELENQGVYANIASKDSVSWRVKWYARKLPASVEVKVGSTSLTNYIEAVLKREAPVTSIASQANNQIKVYPNPATTMLSVEPGTTIGKDTHFQVFDVQGRIVLSCKLSQSKAQINIEHLQQGFYIYDIRQGNETVSKGQLLIRH
jgi:hypothetical protein